MKIHFDHYGLPFFLAHGGATSQVKHTAESVRLAGCEVDFVRWWEEGTKPDVIHSFGVPDQAYIDFAQRKGIAVVNTTLFTEQCNRSSANLRRQGFIIRQLLKLPQIPPWRGVRAQVNWECYAKCDLCIVGLEAEAEVLTAVFGVPETKIRIVPLGLPETFLNAGHGSRQKEELITTGTITERKRSLELARMAKTAEVPIRFVGKPYERDGNYWKEFEAMIDDRFVRYTEHVESVDEMIRMLQESRGYVLYSDYENWCLSAHEAIACGLPVMVPDQRWSRERFGTRADYFQPGDDVANSKLLRRFYERAPDAPVPEVALNSWKEVGTELAGIYRNLLS